ncbi:hypothetical protein GF407_11340 [candidate division KSB1 bacterium]|nr:hypothetical protein [candidate division KSB1 bacterium]
MDDYRIVHFKENGEIKSIFTTNVQTCTAIAGYEPVSDAGFIAHFSPAFDAIVAALSDINASLQQINGNGLKAMRCCVVGSVRDQADSIDYLMTAFAELVRYGVAYEDIFKHNTGVSRSLFIYQGNITVF